MHLMLITCTWVSLQSVKNWSSSSVCKLFNTDRPTNQPSIGWLYVPQLSPTPHPIFPLAHLFRFTPFTGHEENWLSAHHSNWKKQYKQAGNFARICCLSSLNLQCFRLFFFLFFFSPRNADIFINFMTTGLQNFASFLIFQRIIWIKYDNVECEKDNSKSCATDREVSPSRQ